MKNLAEGNIYKNYLVFSIPMVLSGLLSQGYGLIDTVIAGRYLGADGLAAIGATTPFVTFISAVFWGFGNGLGVYMAVLFGAKRFLRIKIELTNHLLAVSGVMLVTSAVIVLFRKGLYRLLCVDAGIVEAVDRYFVIYMLGLIWIVMSNYGVSLMNAFGSGGFPFVMSLLSAVLNVGGNVLTVTVFRQGVAGIALASVLSALIVDIGYYIKLRRCYAAFGVRRDKAALSLRTLPTAYRYCLPTSVQQTVMYLAMLVISPLVNGIGKAASAAYTVVIRIYDINASIYQNSSKTVTTYTAQSIGSRKLGGLRKGLWVGLLQGILFLLPALLLCTVCPRQICSLFFDGSTSKTAFDYAVTFLRSYLPLIAVNMVANLFHSYYRACGDMVSLFCATLFGSFSRIVFSLILIPLYGMTGMYLGWVISWITDAAFGYIYYLCGKWKKHLPVSEAE